jgi:hypothetical protein
MHHLGFLERVIMLRLHPQPLLLATKGSTVGAENGQEQGEAALVTLQGT